MSSRKQVMIAIAVVEKQLQNHQAIVHEHKRYLLAWVHENTLTFVTILLSAFFVGWCNGKKSSVATVAKHAGKLLSYLPKIGFLAL